MLAAGFGWISRDFGKSAGIGGRPGTLLVRWRIRYGCFRSETQQARSMLQRWLYLPGANGRASRRPA